MKKLNKTSFLKLTLDRETIRRLSSAELEQAIGGSVLGSDVFLRCHSRTCPVQE